MDAAMAAIHCHFYRSVPFGTDVTLWNLQVLKRLDLNDSTVQKVLLACTPLPVENPSIQVGICAPHRWLS